MPRVPPKKQSGFALIVVVLAFMTAGGLLIVGFSEGVLDSVETKKIEHNKRVLQEAKQALLQHAYNYPVTNDGGPGRLPCTDIDNDGDSDTAFGTCISIGRLPWREPNLHLYDIRDADGQRLWYVVSDAFATNVSGGNVVNSSSSGTITLRDQSGAVIFDGSSTVAQDGIAAVIIAPGAITSRNGVRQDRAASNSDDPFDAIADTDTAIISPVNYLDQLVGVEDNATFTHSSSTNGFILGPTDTDSTDAVNDQFIVITAAEVIAMAEKAAMQAYAEAIEDFRQKTGECTGEIPDGATTETDCLAATTPGTWTRGPYPWLFNFKDIPDYASLSDYYPANTLVNCVGEDNPEQWTEVSCVADNGTWTLGSLAPGSAAQTVQGNIGRIPVVFGNYFTADPGLPIETEVQGYFDVSFPTGFNWSGGKDSGTLDHGANFTPTFNFSNAADVQFSSLTSTTGRLTATFPSVEPAIDFEMFFWTDHTTDMKNMDIWNSTPCLDDNGDGVEDLSDCEYSWAYTGSNNGAIRMEVTLDWPATSTLTIDLDYSTPPDLSYTPATATSHAMVWATFPAASVLSTMPGVTNAIYEVEHHYHWGNTTLDNDENGDVTIGDFSLNELTLGIRYYPEFPQWAFDNDWHNSMILHYAWDYRPGGDQDCDATVFSAEESCIFIRERDFTGTEPWNRHFVAVLLNTGEHDWVDSVTGKDGTGDLPGAASFLNDKADWDEVVDNGNREFDYIMRIKHPGDPGSSIPAGNDNFLILELQPHCVGEDTPTQTNETACVADNGAWITN